MQITSIKKHRSLSGQRALVRVDFNAPIKDGKVLDDARILASLPTVKYLIKQKAKVILVTHVGRPKGKTVSSLKVGPVAKHLSKLLKKKVGVVSVRGAASIISKMRPGQVIMLENIRFSADEKKDSGMLAKKLASYADLFVLDGFSVSHRPSASVVGVAHLLPSYAGLLLEKEIHGLSKVTRKPKQPFVMIIGGAKTATKIPLVRNLLPTAEYILLGGGLVNTYLAGAGYGVGSSLVESEYMKEAAMYCKKKKVITPLDAVVGTRDGKNFKLVEIGEKAHEICKKGEGIYDIGPQTIELFSGYIEKAKTLVWNGAMGVFEVEPFSVGTFAIADMVADRSTKNVCYGVIGGGETLQSMELAGRTGDIDLVSTGGGAMLELLGGATLPGIEALCS